MYYKKAFLHPTAWLAQSVERTTLSTSVLKSYGRGFEPRIGLTTFFYASPTYRLVAIFENAV